MLIAIHPAYAAATPEQIEAVANGCGPGAWKLDLIPDHLGDVDITDCCNQHDYLYSLGGDEYDRKRADVLLYANIAGDVLLHGGYFVPLRMAAAAIFYRAVRRAGAEFFGVK